MSEAVYLTGATGFLGAHLLPLLVAQGLVTAVQRNGGLPGAAGVDWEHGDLAQPGWSPVFAGPVQAVVHLAQGEDYWNFPDRALPLFEVNVAATLSLLEFARRHGAKKFVLASTANVYGKSHDPLTEDAPHQPESFYARTKCLAEDLTRHYGDFMEVWVLRFFTLYGPGQKNALFTRLREKIETGQPLQVQGKEGLPLSPLYVTDACEVLQTVLRLPPQAPGWRALNVAGAERHNVLGIGRTMAQALKKPLKLEFLPGDEPPGFVADVSAIKSLMPTFCPLTLEQGLAQWLSAQG